MKLLSSACFSCRFTASSCKCIRHHGKINAIHGFIIAKDRSKRHAKGKLPQTAAAGSNCRQRPRAVTADSLCRQAFPGSCSGPTGCGILIKNGNRNSRSVCHWNSFSQEEVRENIRTDFCRRNRSGKRQQKKKGENRRGMDRSR